MPGKLIPNSYQKPNFYVDALAYFLTPEENVVLDKATREILGWHNKIEDRKARIALSVFVDGKFNSAGDRLCHGCGLSANAVRKALKALDRFGILVKIPGSVTNQGQMFRLQDDDCQIDWDALEERRATWDAKNERRTRKATKASLRARGHAQEGEGLRQTLGVTSDVRGEVTSDVREGVTCDDNKETQEKPSRNPDTTTPPAQENAFTALESAGIVLTKYTADEIGVLIDECEGHRQSLPEGVPGADVDGDGWVREAVAEGIASGNGRVNLRYISAILERWQREGFKSERGGNDGDNRSRGRTRTKKDSGRTKPASARDADSRRAAQIQADAVRAALEGS